MKKKKKEIKLKDLKIERMKKDMEKMQRVAEQGSSADQGASQHNLLGDNLKEMFGETEDEIRSTETGEPGQTGSKKIQKGW